VLACHSVGPDAKNKVGPVLNGLDGRTSRTVEATTTARPTEAHHLEQDSFADYIRSDGESPGTKMAFAGISNEKEIVSLWAYLDQFKADGSKK
jgi:cytochrome c